jgi:nitroreductase
MLRDLITRNRTFRRYHEEVAVERETLERLVDLGRLSASGGNYQPLKYILVCDPQRNAQVFSTLAWAMHLPDWLGPEEGERPSAYIVILGDTTVRGDSGVDHGIAAQSILLGATEMGLGGCMLGGVQRKRLRAMLEIPDHYRILLVVALGKPKEKVVLEDLPPGGDHRYHRDADGTHYVPKRRLEDIIVG